MSSTENGTGMTHLPECPCSEVPSGRYCYLIDTATGRCIDCECDKK